MQTIWSTACVGIGPKTEELAQMGMVVTFGTNAPDEIAEFCVSITVQPVSEPIVPGNYLQIGDQAFPVTAVGDVAQENLGNLGHVTFNFDGATEPSMPGTIHVEGAVPAIEVGTELSLIAA
ncbi:PTS glucitol/sorbitol transporter subunit IIA [Stomatohabitans albus]|uniref:PTS glucitol/sorbitol transporter subunit IIA n=1 Tax=Stomatohabitans albus TaxID=3110766 RepID=UPI00300C37BA